MNNFKNTYIKIKDTDNTVERIKEIADKNSRASGCDLEDYLKDFNSGSLKYNFWTYIEVDASIRDQPVVKIFSGNPVSDFMSNLKEITEQDLDNYLSTQLPNNEPDSKECCEGAVIIQHDDILNDVTKWACFQQVADVIGEEDAEFELNKVKMKHLDGCMKLHTEADLGTYFIWEHSPQGDSFWNDINDLLLPEEYKKEPFKPTLVIDDDVLDRMKDTFNDDFSDNDKDDNKDAIGSLVERLYTSLSPSNINISVNGTGQILIHGDKIPTVDVSRLEADEITKAYEAMVMLEGLICWYFTSIN